MIYIREIHPTDGWQVSANEQDGVLVAQPATLEDRVGVGATCMLKMALEMPALVDEMDDRVCNAYAALPERLYLVGRGGLVVYKGGIGPMFFEPDEWEAEIKRYIDSDRSGAA